MAAKLYEAAADVIQKALEKTKSTKSLCFSSRFHNKRKLFALVAETLKYWEVLEKILDKVQFPVKKINDTLKLVLLYEILFGRGVPANYEHYNVLNQSHKIFCASLEEITEQFPDLIEKQNKKRICLPKYARVNVLKTNTEEVVKFFINNGFTKVVEKGVQELCAKEFCLDEHIPNLLIFPNGTDFHKMSFYLEGKFIVQDKASCLPAFILNPPSQSFIIDACAAPGNKSSHLAAIIHNEGNIHSFDIDQSRLNVMKQLLKKAGAICVRAKHQDFLKVKHSHNLYSKAEYILLDPSCSGSGIVSRMDDLIDKTKETPDPEGDDSSIEKRLKGLSGFQTAALSHALTFPHVQKVVYSTCSVHQQENEDVIEKAFKRFQNTFKLVHILPEWKSRGVGSWDQAAKCIRANPESDYTNGFFVALFERVKPNVDDTLTHNQQTVNEENDFERKRKFNDGASVATANQKHREPVKKLKTTSVENSKSLKSEQAVDFKLPVKKKNKHGKKYVKQPVTVN